ncbi:RAMP superfamily CRISPR-associated protein [Desulfurispora thermophila]|uniref:RAMP superfamily CRISPR-associated protein n=1 Tax=Desulfurispora thermophila TaxID=265470 RepID=UPI000379C549|nr:RAMP superfamily CRISPR-associated protein [Desulfurispora thermophila]
MFKRVRIEIIARPRSRWHSGSAGAESGLLDKYLLLDGRGRPYIPGSSLKGKLRAYARQLVNCLEGFVRCSDTADCSCDVCELFGTGGNRPGRLYFPDLYLSGEERGFTLHTAGRVALERYRRVARDQALAFIQVAELGAGSVWQGEITGSLDERAFKRQLVLLSLALRQIYALGGGVSGGWGRLKLDWQVYWVEQDEEKNLSFDLLRKWSEEIGMAG